MFAAGITRSFFIVEPQAANASQPVLDLAPYLEVKRPSMRRSLALGTAMVATLAGIGIAERAHAQAIDACGPISEDGIVVCDEGGNPFADGIAYQAPAADPGDPASDMLDLGVLVRSGVAISMPADGNAVPAIDLSATGGAGVALEAEAGSSVRTRGAGQTGLAIRTEAGDIAAIAPDIMTGGAGARGINLQTTDGGAIDLATGVVVTGGDGARAINARTAGGDVTVMANGIIGTLGSGSTAITANSGGGTASITAGDVVTYGDSSDAVVAIGSDAIIVLNGSVATYGSQSYGAYAQAVSGVAQVTLDGAIETYGVAGRGIRAFGAQGASVTGSGSIVTHGALATGVIASAQTGDVVVDLASVTSLSEGASGSGGISANSYLGDASVRVGDVSTRSDYFSAITASSTGGNASVETTGTVSTTGNSSTGINVFARNVASAAVNDVLTTGYGSGAINASGNAVDIAISGTVAAQGGGDGYGAAVTAVGRRFVYSIPVGVDPDTGDTIYSYQAADVGGDVAVHNDGAVAGLGGGMAGILVGADGAVTISGTGNVMTSGDFANAVQVEAGEDVAIAMGTIATDGDASGGVAVRTGGALAIAVDDISTVGAAAPAVVFQSASADVAVGSIATSGYGSHGIVGAAETGDVNITVGSLSTAGDLANGIVAASAGGEVAVTVDTLSTQGYQANGIMAVALNGAAVSVGSASVTGDSATGVDARSFGDTVVAVGDLIASGYAVTGVDVTAQGLASVTVGSAVVEGDYADGIVATAGGDVVVEAGNVAATGFYAQGISVTTGGTATIGLESGEVSGTYATAINVTAAGETTILAGSLSAEGYYAGGIFVTGEGSVTVGLESGTASGEGADVISVQSYGDVNIAAGQVAADGNYSVGIYAQSAGETNLIVDSAAASGYYATAIDVSAAVGANVAAAEVLAEGDNSNGVRIQTYGDASVLVGSAAASGYYATAINVGAGTGFDIAADSLVAVGDEATGVYAQTTGAGFVAVGAAVVDGGGAAAIDIQAGQYAGVAIGDLTVSGDGARGVLVSSGGVAAVSISGTVIGSADQLRGPDVPVGPGGRIQDPASAIISVQALDTSSVIHDGTITTTGTLEGGIAARGYNGVAISGSGSVSTAGDGATGIYGGANTGVVAISTGSVTTAGDDAHGVFARGYGVATAAADMIVTGGDRSVGLVVEAGFASVAAVGSVTTSGAGAHGVVSHSYGMAYGAAETISVSGAGALGMNVASYGMGDAVAVAGDVIVADGRGIEAIAVNGSASILAGTVTQGSTMGSNAIAAFSTGDANIAFGSVSSSGDGFAAAVRARTDDGNIAIEGGSVSAVGDGRDAIVATSSYGDIAIAIDGSIVSDGINASGIFARTFGKIDIAAADVTTNSAYWAAIQAEGSEVTLQAGSVLATGDRATEGPLAAVSANAYFTVDVTVGTVAATGADRNGVAISSGEAGSLTVQSGGSVIATNDAVTFLTGGGATLTNAGTITGGSGAAVRASGAAATIANSGTISGMLALTDGDDSVTNSGTLRLTTGTSFGGGDDRLVNSGALALAGDVDFGAGTDSIVNSGTVRLDGGTANAAVAALATGPVSRSITGLESFASSGLIEMRNGVAGDVLNLSGAFAGSGGSMVGLDIAYGATVTADRLVIGGAATGSTTLTLAISGDEELGLSPTLIQAGAGTSATAFTLAPGQATDGMLARGLLFDGASNSFALAVAPSVAAYRLLNVGEAAQSLWIESADSVASHLAANRDAGVTGSGFWMAATGGVAKRSEAGVFSAFGFDQTADIGYRQDVFGSQFGVDLGSGPIGFGLTGGYANSVMRFAGSADRITFDAWNIGAYASVSSGAFFANALAKYDFYDVKAKMAGADKVKSDGSAWGGRAEIGFSLGSDALHIEPVASISWQHVSIDPLDLPLAVDFDDLEGGRASAGLRLRSKQEIGGGAVLNLYAQGDYVQPFGGNDTVTFSTATTGIAFDDDRIGAYGKGRIGLSITQGRVTGFIEGDGRFSSDYRGGGGKAGLRIAF